MEGSSAYPFLTNVWDVCILYIGLNAEAGLKLFEICIFTFRFVIVSQLQSEFDYILYRPSIICGCIAWKQHICWNSSITLDWHSVYLWTLPPSLCSAMVLRIPPRLQYFCLPEDDILNIAQASIMIPWLSQDNLNACRPAWGTPVPIWGCPLTTISWRILCWLSEIRWVSIRVFFAMALHLWNSLPEDIHLPQNILRLRCQPKPVCSSRKRGFLRWLLLISPLPLLRGLTVDNAALRQAWSF